MDLVSFFFVRFWFKINTADPIQPILKHFLGLRKASDPSIEFQVYLNSGSTQMITDPDLVAFEVFENPFIGENFQNWTKIEFLFNFMNDPMTSNKLINIYYVINNINTSNLVALSYDSIDSVEKMILTIGSFNHDDISTEL
jgi:hypothetical protein